VLESNMIIVIHFNVLGHVIEIHELTQLADLQNLLNHRQSPIRPILMISD
jgi:hypothetical protein